MAYKILIADDDFDNRVIAAEALNSFGYHTLQAINGSEAYEIAAQEKPDLILLDLSMPKLDGWETVKKLKATPDLAKIPVIALTAHAMRGDEQKAKEAGCDDYVAKPCSPHGIVEVIKKWLPR